MYANHTVGYALVKRLFRSHGSNASSSVIGAVRRSLQPWPIMRGICRRINKDKKNNTAFLIAQSTAKTRGIVRIVEREVEAATIADVLAYQKAGPKRTQRYCARCRRVLIARAAELAFYIPISSMSSSVKSLSSSSPPRSSVSAEVIEVILRSRVCWPVRWETEIAGLWWGLLGCDIEWRISDAGTSIPRRPPAHRARYSSTAQKPQPA